MITGAQRTALAHDGLAVKEEIGRGGVGLVLRAHDRLRDEDVALKILRPELAHTLETERFLDEVATLAKLDHPNIVPLWRHGDAAGAPYYTMPLFEASLRAELLEHHYLRNGRLMRVARGMAEALDHAHARRVIHRDVKPENVLFDNGHVRLADFGIAAACCDCADLATCPPEVFGTPGYMAPEQAIGIQTLDERADVYGLGATLFEAVTGIVPPRPATERERVAERWGDLPPDARARLDGAGARVETALIQALHVNPLQRPATAGHLVHALVSSDVLSP